MKKTLIVGENTDMLTKQTHVKGTINLYYIDLHSVTLIKLLIKMNNHFVCLSILPVSKKVLILRFACYSCCRLLLIIFMTQERNYISSESSPALYQRLYSCQF